MNQPKKRGVIRSADNLEDFIIEETTSEINCSKCSNYDGSQNELDYTKHIFFKKGWRATKNNVYCPICAKKYLKH